MVINNELIKKVLGIGSEIEFECGQMAGIHDVDDRGILTYCSSSRYVSVLNRKENVVAVITSKETSELISDRIVKVVVDDPVFCFYKIYNYLADAVKYESSIIGDGCIISVKATISDKGVVIADNVCIEDNVVIYPGVTIGPGCVIKAGAVLGADGFEVKRTSKGLVSVKHDGKVILSEDVEVGVNTQIAKGFSYRDTVIGPGTKIDSLVHIAHGVWVGQRCLIVGNAMVAGHVTIGNDVWVGPSSSISNRVEIGDGASVTLGAVVVRSVPSGETVTGNFAIQHEKFLKRILKNDRLL